ncbi:MAG: hypothetical protein H6597_03680 [Flavobacteriales bacterium]|nr:hypothetical protein [Flavobacteriales bacterium]
MNTKVAKDPWGSRTAGGLPLAASRTMDIRGFIADQMGLFTPYDIPGIILSVLFAWVIAYVLLRWGARQDDRTIRRLVVLSASAALGVALVKASVPLAIAFVALMLLAGPFEKDGTRASRWLNVTMVVIGGGCGAGGSLVVLIAALPILLLLRWASVPADQGR